MKILYLLADQGLDLTQHQGYAVHVRKIIHGLNAIGHQTFLLTINSHSSLLNWGQHLCIPHAYVRGIHKILPYTGCYDSCRIFHHILSLSQRFQFDIIHERYGMYSSGGVWAAHFLKVPYVLEVNAPLIEEKRLFTTPVTGWQKFCAHFTAFYNFKTARKIIVVSQLLTSYLTGQWKIPENRIHVMPNAADVDMVADDLQVKEIRSCFPGRRIIVGYVGTFQPWFGIENLIAAFASAATQLNHLALLLIGDGAARSQLERLIHKFQIAEKVHFTGAISHEQIPGYLAAIDIAVAPYRELPMGFYGSSMKVFEYMAAGKAIIASALGQITEIIAHERDGLLVPAGNIDELSRAIIRLAENQSFRKFLGANAQLKARQRYSWQNYIKQLEVIYKSV